MRFAAEVKKVNDLLGRELGRAANGLSIYSWMWSEHLIHPRRRMHDDGTLIYDYKGDPETGLIVAHPVYEIVKKGGVENLRNQWVLCKWHPPIPEREWIDMFGYMLEWPKHGEYWPISVQSGGVVALRRDDDNPPTEGVTLHIIQSVRRELAKRNIDRIAEMETAADKHEKSEYERIRYGIKDRAPAFGGVPGRKSGWVTGGLPVETNKEASSGVH